VSLRVPNTTMNDRVLTDLQSSYSAMAKTARQVSSGKVLERISDDPVAAARARSLHNDISGLEGARTAADTATSWLTAAESGLKAVNDALGRARDLAVSGVSGTSTQDARNSMAIEIDNLIQTVKDSLSARSGDSYVFSGTATTTAAYSAATGDVPQSDTGNVIRDLGPGAALTLNPSIPTLPTGTATLTAAAIGGDGTDGRAIATLRALAAHLRAGDTASISNTDLRALDANMATVSSARAAVGVTQNRVDAATSRLEQLGDTAETLRSSIEDTDLAKALTQLTAQQTAYQAALKSGASIIQPSLLDFLR
jgi:flagellar hook-associated protein 3 FlgL